MKPNLSGNLGLAIVGSFLLNGGLFYAMSLGASQIPKSREYRTVEVRRVDIDNAGRKIEKLVQRKEVEQKIKKLVEEKKIVPLPQKSVSKPIQEAPKPKTSTEPVKPEGAHNKVITAPSAAGEKSKPEDFTAQGGGNADVGKPTTGQGAGEGKVNPPEPPKTEPPKADPPKADPPKVDPPKVDPPAEPPVKPDPPKVDPPRPKGPSKEAEPSRQVLPKIPDNLKSQDFKSFVRVVVEIDADGSFEVSLRTSSGNEEVDRRVLEALKKWKWKPALKEGEPIKSTQRFKFNFEVG